jgi:hypothetical protein
MKNNLIEQLTKNNIVTGLIWENSFSENNAKGYRQWIEATKKSHHQVVYTDKQNRNHYGYTDKPILQHDPFATYISTQFGDGIYYSAVAEDLFYLLIISNGQIISGTDQLIGKAFFYEIKRLIPESTYSQLDFITLQDKHIETVIELCEKRKKKLRKQRILFYSALLLTVIGVMGLSLVLFDIFFSG